MPVPAPDRRPHADRRKDPRAPSSGRLEMVFGDPAPERLVAELTETSSMGFRATHDCKTLEPGLEVLCKFDGAKPVRARV